MQQKKSHLKPSNVPLLQEWQKAYLAGIIDGEAHIRKFFVRKTSIGNNYGFEIQIAQNTLPLLETIKEWTKEGTINKKKVPKATKQVYYWAVRKRLVIKDILKQVLPYLIVKQKVAEEILETLEKMY